MSRKKLQRRVAELEAELTEYRLPPSMTFDTLTVCWTDRTVTFRGRTITSEANCVSFPVTNDQYLLERAGWVAYAGRIP